MADFGVFVEMLEKQDQTDVVFKLGESDNAELFGAHKFILGAVSPIFKTMFSENWSTERKPIVIKDGDTNLFKTFIKIVYTHHLPQVAKKQPALIALYELSQMYQISDVQDLVLKHMLPICNSSNLILFANLAWLHNEVQLKKTCLKYFSKYARYIVNRPEFLTAKTDVINAFYSLDAMTIDSEDSLVLKMDKYIMENLRTQNIIEKLKPAIDCIRLLIIKETTIVACKNTAFKNILWKGLKKLRSPLTYGPVPLIMELPRRKVTVLSSLPSDMIIALYKNFSDRNFYNQHWIYKRYCHTDLCRYSGSDIISILDEFNQLAINNSEYKIFENYKMYLDL